MSGFVIAAVLGIAIMKVVNALSNKDTAPLGCGFALLIGLLGALCTCGL